MLIAIILVATIGFNPVDYSVVEDAGPVNFMFSVLEGNIAFDVSVLFSTTGGSAISKRILSKITLCSIAPFTQF